MAFGFAVIIHSYLCTLLSSHELALDADSLDEGTCFLQHGAAKSRSVAETPPYSRVKWTDTSVYAQTTKGKHVAWAPSSPSNSDLLVFFPGTSSFCGYYSGLLDLAGSKMNVLCLSYDVSHKSKFWRRGGTFSQRAHRAQVRLVEALKKLSYEEKHSSWINEYLDDVQEPIWSKIRVAGHSQGSVIAAFIAYKVNVARFTGFAGPSRQFGRQLNWMEQKPKTLPEKVFAIEAVNDNVLHWEKYTWAMYDAQDPPGYQWSVGQRGVRTNLAIMGATRIQEVTLEEHNCCENGTQIVLLNIKSKNGHAETCMNFRHSKEKGGSA
eukprot:CAMPEP_0197639130 /NCGR_PEP_ID=MMETSP1338-20131121/13842_1 /TAXON_ID=43686 ORGANISM="Pelagodinium beii, Strain RCC1491" /NCGR_SAMPLE_ID=MMETSP1338 /ASSEMBLY_ACC=CAM_ASM_000754 /LENGTH=321 /DNA_ID=CAMNT_0043211811 /DNA_START=27 /DNA_END=989 /DNA_ORIENTATION=-